MLPPMANTNLEISATGQEAALETLDDVNHRLPILFEATQVRVNRVLKLFENAMKFRFLMPRRSRLQSEQSPNRPRSTNRKIALLMWCC